MVTTSPTAKPAPFATVIVVAPPAAPVVSDCTPKLASPRPAAMAEEDDRPVVGDGPVGHEAGDVRALTADGHVVHRDVDAHLAAAVRQLLRVHEVGAGLELDDLPACRGGRRARPS